MTEDSFMQPVPRRKRGRPIDEQRRVDAEWVNQTITVLPNMMARGIVSCVAYDRPKDAARQLRDATLVVNRRKARAVAEELAELLRQTPRLKEFFTKPFARPSAADEMNETWISMERGLLELEEMMNHQTIATSAYRVIVERDHPELAHPKNAYDKDRLKGEMNKIKIAAREVAAPFEKAREERKKRIRGGGVNPVSREAKPLP